MGDIQFEHFKRGLQDAISDPDFVRKNTLMQDSTYQGQVSERITSLTMDQNIKENWVIESQEGLLNSDVSHRQLKFDPKGFSIALSRFREGVVQTPGKIWRRPDPVTDEIYYLLSDNDRGVLMLGHTLEVIRLFPGFGPDLAGNQEYDSVSSAIAFTVGVQEYVAIAMDSHHVVSIYEYPTGIHVANIGTIDTPGTPDSGAFLDTPVDLAFNAASNELWIACSSGQPTGATASNGFLATFDLSVPAAPSLLAIPSYYETDGSLLHREVNAPSGLYIDPTLNAVWVANGGSSEIGAIDNTNGVLVKFFESRTLNYTLSSPSSIRIRDLGAGTRWLYVANSAYGTIEVFDITTQKHVNTYGFRSTEDTAVSQTDFVFGSIGQASGVMPDTVTIDGVETEVIVVSDNLNGRVQRINEESYDTDNYVNFAARSFIVPLHLIGWAISGDVPTDLCTVYYRTSTTDTFKILDPITHVPYGDWFQFRLAVRLDRGRIVRPWTIKELIIIGEQV